MDDPVDNSLLILADEWDIKELGSNLPDERVSVENGTISVSIDSGQDSSNLIELRRDLNFMDYNELEINFSLRCHKIGRDDNSTGKNSFFSFEYNDQHNDIGFKIIIIGDRYKVDNFVSEEFHNHLKIFRTDTSWHDWSFKIDVNGQAISMKRDGTYYAKHKIGKSRQKNGVEILISGNEEIPVKVELGSVLFKPSISTQGKRKNLESISSKDANEPELGDWPMFRKDRMNSGHSRISSDFRQSKVAWKYSLGGFSGEHYLADLNNDGLDEILVSYPGSLTSYDMSGKKNWSKPIVNCEVLGLHDLDGNGVEELVIAGGSPKAIQIVDPLTGELLYKCDYDPTYDVVFVRIASLDPSKPGKQIVVTTRHEIGYCLSFEEGIEKGKVAFTFDWMITNFIPAVAIADMDLDGKNEIVLGTYGNFFVFDGQDGGVKSHLVVPTGRNYGLMVLEDVNGDGYLDIIMLAHQLREHISVIKNHKGQYLELLWDKLFEQNYPTDFKELMVYEQSVSDYDEDGNVEILFGLFDELDGNQWTTYIVDALTGKEKVKLTNSFPVGMMVQENSGKRYVVLSENQPRNVAEYSDIKIISFENGSAKTVGEIDNCRILFDDSPRDFELNTFSTSSPPRTFQELKKFKDSFFFVHGDNHELLSLAQLADNKIVVNDLVHLPLDNLPEGRVLRVSDAKESEEINISYSGQDTKIYFINSVGSIFCSVQAGGYVGFPLVAGENKNEPKKIVVHNAKNMLLVLSENSEGEVLLEWQKEVHGSPSGYDSYQGRMMPLIGDLNGDKKNEILVKSKKNELLILGFDGNDLKQFELPGEPIFWSYGSFIVENLINLYVSYSLGTVSSQSTILNYNSSDPEKNWILSIGNGVPAIYDLDNDGLDDIVMRDLFEHRSVKGSTGEDIFPITSWAGYHMPTVIENEVGHAPQILWSGGNYSLVLEQIDGKQQWWKPFMANRSPAGVADVNGDDKFEVGGYTVGQLYNWPEFYPVDGPNNEFVCYDLNSGEMLWKHFIGSPISGVITADIDNDELPEFIFGTADGRLIALNGDSDDEKRVAFEKKFPASLGTPIIVDLDGKGSVQIIVGCADGNLYSLKPN